MKYFIGEHTNQYVNIAITNQGFLRWRLRYSTYKLTGKFKINCLQKHWISIIPNPQPKKWVFKPIRPPFKNINGGQGDSFDWFLKKTFSIKQSKQLVTHEIYIHIIE